MLRGEWERVPHDFEMYGTGCRASAGVRLEQVFALSRCFSSKFGWPLYSVSCLCMGKHLKVPLLACAHPRKTGRGVGAVFLREGDNHSRQEERGHHTLSQDPTLQDTLL